MARTMSTDAELLAGVAALLRGNGINAALEYPGNLFVYLQDGSSFGFRFEDATHLGVSRYPDGESADSGENDPDFEPAELVFAPHTSDHLVALRIAGLLAAQVAPKTEPARLPCIAGDCHNGRPCEGECDHRDCLEGDSIPLVCPKGHSAGFTYLEDIVNSRHVRGDIDDGVLAIESYYTTSGGDDGDNPRLCCDQCGVEFPIPTGIELEFV